MALEPPAVVGARGKPVVWGAAGAMIVGICLVAGAYVITAEVTKHWLFQSPNPSQHHWAAFESNEK